MQIGQTYKIQVKISLLDERLFKRFYEAKLIQETKHFYTFEYDNGKGYKRKETIAKNDCRNNKNLIAEG